jgi:pyruvate dehydrogenase E1 component alpha subunit
MPAAAKSLEAKRQVRSDEAPKAGARSVMGPKEELQAYREMLLIRRFEEKAGQLYGMGLSCTAWA